MNIYDVRRYGKIVFLVITVAVVAFSLYITSRLIHDLAEQERQRMEIWADATKQLASADENSNLEFLFSIIERNKTIPVVLTDSEGNILSHHNFDLPEPQEEFSLDLTPVNEKYLRDKLERLRDSDNVIEIRITPIDLQYLYYEDSKLLKNLSIFPYVQLAVMLTFILVVYFAVASTKRAEQNKVWVGLSKETAHQLGTPISSLMAWMEILDSQGVDSSIVREMNKDVNRLSTIASRFSKIGSKPAMERADLNQLVASATAYMATRISSQIKLTVDLFPGEMAVKISPPLLEWVMENLIKNAVDAMEGSGAISVTLSRDSGDAVIDVADTGKGIPRKHQKTVFNPGFTTKKRGWGLGLTLAKRIVEQYHNGRIFVLKSEPGAGTTFRIILPLAK